MHEQLRNLFVPTLFIGVGGFGGGFPFLEGFAQQKKGAGSCYRALGSRYGAVGSPYRSSVFHTGGLFNCLIVGHSPDFKCIRSAGCL